MAAMDFTHSEKWKSGMNFFYSVGASIVLLGALFKLQHWPGANIILPIGMLIEVVIFLFSAFEPSVDIPDWSKVHPQLRKDYTGGPAEITTPSHAGASGNIFDQADISPELLAKVKKGLQDLSTTASGIADISTATLATDSYVKNLTSASESMSTFKEVNTRAAHSIEKSTNDLVYSYDQSTQILGDSSKNLASTFNDSTKKINDQLIASGDSLATSYKRFNDSINKDLAALDERTSSYSAGLEKVNTSIAALHTSYELHLQHTKKVTTASADALDTHAKMTDLVKSALEEAAKYQKQTEQLNKNLEALNHVYGNMLGAMNAKG